jgi:hypothetical protein
LLIVLVRALLVTLMLAIPASPVARGSEGEERIWILPFTALRPDPPLSHLEDALPALLAVAITGSGGRHAVVEREQLNRVLSEQSLSLEGLTWPAARHRVGRLLGATVMITGSFLLEGDELHLTMRALDLETGFVASTADGRGAANEPGALVADLYRRLAAGRGRTLPELAADRIDEAPLSNLHFMKGLGHYHSARYSLSVAEFMQAAADRPLADVSRLWMARAYLAQRQYSHACLELARLEHSVSARVRASDVEEGLRECGQQLRSEDMKLIRDLARRERTAR